MKKIPYKANQKDPAVIAYKEAIEKGKNNQHVLPRKNEWIVKRADSDKPSKVFITQREATEYANSIAQNQGTAVFIHSSDGTIRERRDYQ